MSLKAFHIAFITICIAFLLGFSLWLFGQYRAHGGALYAATGVLSVAACPALALYGLRFLRKLKGVPFP